MDVKNWCSSSKSSASTPATTPAPKTSRSTTGVSPLSDLMKEVDEQIRFTMDYDHTLEPPKQQQQQQQQHRPSNNFRSSVDRFVDVREDILQMKNELNALKKDLSSAKRGLESDKKPLMVRKYILFYVAHLFLD
jgi:hypothetical protein